MPEFCIIERDAKSRILTVTINRPELLNALHPPASFELAKVFDDFAADDEMRVAILTGAGERAFCAGNDLKYTAAGRELKAPASGFGGLTSRRQRSKPILAAVNGVAMGGGFELALACDLLIASERAIFALPEPKVGLAALAGGLLRLPREIPLKQAMGMILTGRRVSAEEGLRLGFVNEVVAPGEVLAATKRWAQQIVEAAPLSIRVSMQVVEEGLAQPSLPEAFAAQARSESVRAMLSSEDLMEGARAFAEKRRPEWKGR